MESRIKTWLEITALLMAALFLILKLGSGQFNSGMKVSMEIHRDSRPEYAGQAFVHLKLERPDSSRITLSDVIFEVYNLKTKQKLTPLQHGDIARIREKAIDGYQLSDKENGEFTSLPPGDSTELEYVVDTKNNDPVLIDCTILGKRRFFQYISLPVIGNAQWRISRISLTPTSEVASNQLR